MKPKNTIVLSLIFVLVAMSAEAGSHDVSLWYKVSRTGSPLPMPWYMYYGENKLVLDARYNYDLSGTGGIFMGRAFSAGKFTLTPEIGVLFGDYRGICPELLLEFSNDRVSYFGQTQWNVGVGDKGLTFGSHWSDFTVKVASHLSVGVDFQVYHERGFTEVDIGPALKIEVKRFYLKVWGGPSVGPQNSDNRIAYFALGAKF